MGAFDDHFVHCYAVKANPLKGVLDEMVKQGTGARDLPSSSYSPPFHILLLPSPYPPFLPLLPLPASITSLAPLLCAWRYHCSLAALATRCCA